MEFTSPEKRDFGSELSRLIRMGKIYARIEQMREAGEAQRKESEMILAKVLGK